VFLTSARPAQTAHFYRDIAGLPIEEVSNGSGSVYWRLDDGHIQIAIHEAHAFAAYAFPPLSASNLTHLYFQIADVPAFLAKLQEFGITPEEADDVVVTLVDPDGRRVLFGVA
jgi:hypothetical protein